MQTVQIISNPYISFNVLVFKNSQNFMFISVEYEKRFMCLPGHLLILAIEYENKMTTNILTDKIYHNLFT